MLDEYRRAAISCASGWRPSRGCGCVKPAGAFYLFPDVCEFLSPDGIRTSAELAQALLDDARVALTPGEAFDAPGFLRISYATSMTELQARHRSDPRVRRALKVGHRRRAVDNSSPCAPAASRGPVSWSELRCVVTDAPCSHLRRRLTARRRRRRPSRTDEASRDTYGTDALKRGHPADVVVFPAGTARSPRSCACAPSTACRSCRAAPAPATPAAPCRSHGGVVLSLERMNRILEIDEANLSRSSSRTSSPAISRTPSSRSGCSIRPIPRRCGTSAHRRQRRRVRRRAARVQVRHDQAVRARARGRAADRRNRRDRRQGRQERRRLRPDAPARRIRRHAGHHHEDHPAAGAEAAGPVDAARDVPERRGRGGGRQQHHQRARRARGARADRRRFARGGRAATSSVRSLAPEGTAAMLLLEVDGMPAGGRRRGGARRAACRRGRRDRDPARATTRRSGRSSGACAASCRCR